ncbi:hypothetical protein J6590_008418 [Homalodisca vitripennis]|nr:hypothetical protein J6590_008418 [Homalodisca vitripennis]
MTSEEVSQCQIVRSKLPLTLAPGRFSTALRCGLSRTFCDDLQTNYSIPRTALIQRASTLLPSVLNKSCVILHFGELAFLEESPHSNPCQAYQTPSTVREDVPKIVKIRDVHWEKTILQPPSELYSPGKNLLECDVFGHPYLHVWNESGE